MSIEVKNLTKRYGEQTALDAVSFKIETGEIAGFIGPNGAGKSTTMKILTGYLPAEEGGEARINGKSIFSDSMEIRRTIGYLPEHNPLYPEMYVKEYLRFVAGIYKIKASNNLINNVIEQTGIGYEQHKKIQSLSKGYRQRVGLAQALIHNPSILILDEPTTGLDPNQIIEIRNLISRVGEHKTVMLSTHIMQEVEAICNKIIVINKGKIVAEEVRENIYKLNENKELSFIVEFETAINSSMLEEIEGLVRYKQISPTLFVVESRDDIRKKIFEFAVSQNIAVLSMQKKESTLEEIFQSLTR